MNGGDWHPITICDGNYEQDEMITAINNQYCCKSSTKCWSNASNCQCS